MFVAAIIFWCSFRKEINFGKARWRYFLFQTFPLRETMSNEPSGKWETTNALVQMVNDGYFDFHVIFQQNVEYVNCALLSNNISLHLLNEFYAHLPYY